MYSVFTPKTLEIQAQTVTEQTNSKFSVFHTDSWNYTQTYFLICHFLFHSVSNTAEPCRYERHVSILHLVKDKSLAHSRKDQLLKLANTENKLILSKVQVNKNASLDHSVPCSLPLTLSIYSIVKRCYVFDQATQILCRFPRKGRVFSKWLEIFRREL